MSKKRWMRMSLLFAGVVCLVSNTAGWAQTEDTIEDRVAERIAEEKGRALTPAEELVEMLKQRAMRKVEEERRKQLLTTKGTIGLHIGRDNNVNTDTVRRGDFYLEQYFSFSWVPAFSDYLGAEVGTWYYSDWYFSNKDTTIIDHALNSSLKLYPWGNPNLELQPGCEKVFAYYPYAETSTYDENKLFLKFKHRFWNKWTQDGKYEYSFKEYDKKHPRLGASGAAYPTQIGMALEKIRHTVEYNFAFPFLSNSNFKIKQAAYNETSNEAYMDYYHVYSYKLTGELGRSLTKKLYAKLSTAFERKNYYERTVPVYNVGGYEDIYTHKGMLYYTLKKNWTLSYTLTAKKSDSNYSIYDYDTMSHVAGIYISF